ncbi:unnamed protein product [Chondrus crispus]|uniref:Uncharacterized protein n=1 Tax=Chondrus crispus TaxID=2769 RepID=R7QRM8_CHOCR|nr:unnamed protein product [Chondrus crispus]CDF39990.1 unnamed protein product [Chondrus crispus]|eukprot:XP_005710284.1 unnamed protein product [Chondrus crispus]
MAKCDRTFLDESGDVLFMLLSPRLTSQSFYLSTDLLQLL